MESGTVDSGRPAAGIGKIVGTVLVIGLFIALATLVIFDRGRIEVDFTRLSSGNAAFYQTNLPFCSGLPACMRIGTAILGYGIEKFLLGLSGIYFSGDAAYRLFAPEVVVPQGMNAWQRVVLDPARLEGLVAPLAATVLLRALCLSTILWAAVCFFSAAWERAVFLFVTFGVLLGWPVSLVVGLFNLMSTIVDWPHHHFLYVYFATSYDFGSLGFVYVLLLTLARPALPGLTGAAMLAAGGQLVFENLGLVTGIAFSIVALFRTSPGSIPPFIQALRYLLATGVASIAVAALVIGGVVAAGPASDGSAGSTMTVVEYFTEYWRNYGRNNLEWWRIIVADSFSILVFPLIFGAAFGIGVRYFGRDDGSGDASASRHQFLAGLGVAVGFLVSLVPGFFISGLTSDIHRQITPVACICVLLASRGAGVLFTRLVRRDAPPR